MRYAKYLCSRNFIPLAYYVLRNVIAADDDSSRDNFGHMYKWKNLQEGFREAKVCRKPIFLLIHRPGCPTCEKLKPKFNNSVRMHDLSQRFVMVGVRKGEIPARDEARFQPDGTYVPRILFFTPDGEFMKDIYNRHPKADDKYKYFYNSTGQIIDSMILALECCCKESPNGFLDDKGRNE